MQRIWQHKEDVVEGFTRKYSVKRLVYFEVHESPEETIRREKQVKSWRWAWKLELMEKHNPEWNDLYDVIIS